jgi:hypothetical protein
MPNINSQEKLKQLQKKLMLTNIISMPGGLLLGLAGLGFTQNGTIPYAPLNDKTVLITMIAIGILMLLWSGWQVVYTVRQIRILKEEINE